jgi:hypothetical protein
MERREVKISWDGRSMSFDGDDWRGKRVTVTPNTEELSIEHSPTGIHIRLPRPDLTVVVAPFTTNTRFSDSVDNPYKIRWSNE